MFWQAILLLYFIMVICCVTKKITCSLMIGQFFDSTIVSSTDKEWSCSTSKSWKVLETVSIKPP